MSIDLSITLSTEQSCDYIVVKNGQISTEEREKYLNIYFPDSDAEFDSETVLLARFNNDLDAGSYITQEETIEGWDIYKQKTGETRLRYVGFMPITSSSVQDHFVENSTEYTYYLFPRGLTVMGTPLVSDPTSSKVWNWIIYTATESSTANVLNVNGAYVFQGNVESGTISNNATSSVMNNFTQYPKVIKGTQNYKSGKLTGLIGYSDIYNNTYTETDGLRDALYGLVTSQDRMFLKNRSGDIWEVSIHSPVTMEIDDKSYLQPNKASIEWVEIANTDDVSLIGEV